MGSVRVQRQGLYYQFSCKCQYLEGLYSLMLDQQKLGLMVLSQGQLVLSTRLPVKRFEQGSGRFSLQPRHTKMPGTFVPLHPAEPFSYLRRLENAYLTLRDGQIGVMLSGEAEQKNVKIRA